MSKKTSRLKFFSPQNRRDPAAGTSTFNDYLSQETSNSTVPRTVPRATGPRPVWEQSFEQIEDLSPPQPQMRPQPVTQAPVYEVPASSRHFVFRVANRRYAILSDRVRFVGRISHRADFRRTIIYLGKELPILDIRRVLGLSGEAGSLFFVMEHKGKLACFAFDGLESQLEIPPGAIREISLVAGGTAPWGARLIQGLYRDVPLGVPTHYRSQRPPICVLNPEVLLF